MTKASRPNDSTASDSLARLVAGDRVAGLQRVQRGFAFARLAREIEAGVRIVCTLGAQVNATQAIVCLRTATAWCPRCEEPRCALHSPQCPSCGRTTLELPKGPQPE